VAEIKREAKTGNEVRFSFKCLSSTIVNEPQNHTCFVFMWSTDYRQYDIDNNL